MRLSGIAVVAAAALALGCAGGPAELEPTVRSPAELQLSRVETAVEAAFLRGLVASRVGDYARARRELEAVASACPAAPIGGQAVLLLAGLALDPRNPERDPEAARELARRYFQSPRKPAWTEPAMEALYLLALELGEPVAGEGTAAGPESSADPAANGAGEDGTSAAATEATSATHARETEPPGTEAGPPAPGEGVPPAAGPEGARGAPAGPVDLSSGGVRCEVGGPEHLVGPSATPALPDVPLAERLREAEADRARLRSDVGRLEQRVAELLQELERIRATLRP